MRRRTLLAGALLAVCAERSAHAQGLAGRVAIEAIAAAGTDARALGDPNVILDLVATVRVAEGLDVVVRPWSMRRPGGDWMFEMYQLQLRYVSSTRVPFRIDAGIIPSPVGLFTLELQPHRNPLVDPPFYYFAPLPSVDGGRHRVRLISGGYPLGAMFTVSGRHWDARAGVTDSSPSQPHNVLGRSRRSEPQLVVGAGVTPVAGVRLGAGFTRGDYHSLAAAGAFEERRGVTVLNIEGEYATGHTRVSGEWVRGRLATPLGGVVARGFNVQATRTLAPRIFAATRATRVSAPLETRPAEVRRTSTAFEASLGYRLSTELTVRGGYQRERGYHETRWRNAAVMSVVWAERWW